MIHHSSLLNPFGIYFYGICNILFLAKLCLITFLSLMLFVPQNFVFCLYQLQGCFCSISFIIDVILDPPVAMSK